METIKKVYISGLGAVGGAYASMLHNMDKDCVKVIADSKRIENFNKNGLVINNKPYFFEYIKPEDEAEPADLILFAVKHHHLEKAVGDVKNFIGKDTVILSLLNGIESEETIGKAYGMEHVLHSMCVGIDAVREGNSIRFANTGRIVFGDRKNDTLSPKVLKVKELFEKAAIPYSIPQDMIRTLWWKFMLNVGVNQTSAVMKAPYGVFIKNPEAIELMETACREVVDISRKAGIDLTEEDIAEAVKTIKGLDPDNKTSMLQDMEAGRKTEVEIFAGTVIGLGKKHGVETPVNKVLFNMIRTMEKMNGIA